MYVCFSDSMQALLVVKIKTKIQSHFLKFYKYSNALVHKFQVFSLLPFVPIADVFSFRRLFLSTFFPFYVFSSRHFFINRHFGHVGVFLHSTFLLLDILSQSMFFTFYVFSTFYPNQRFLFSMFCPSRSFFSVDVLSHSAFFLSTFCPSMFFPVVVVYFVMSVNPTTQQLY